MTAIALEGVGKDFAPPARGPAAPALADVTLRIPAGAVTGLVGPNGSGKSTLLKILVGLGAPTRGACRIFGLPAGSVEARRAVGYLPEAPEFCPQLTGFEVVWYHARLGGVPAAAARDAAQAALARVGLAGAMHRRAGTYSLGMRQRLGLAQALAPEPRLLVLDEPVSGVDPVGAEQFRRLVLGFKAEGRTVVFSSHDLRQVEQVCDRVVMLDRGRVILQGRVGELAGRAHGVTLRVEALPAALLAELREWLRARGAAGCETEPAGGELERVFLRTLAGTTAGGP